MKKKLVLKPFVLPSLYVLMVVTLLLLSSTMIFKQKENDNITYVPTLTIDDVLPVISEIEEYVEKPYKGENVAIKTNYYDYKETAENQVNSIVKYDDTYLQNSGIIYFSEKEFEVASIMDGKVTKIYDNDLLGKIVEITHDKNMVSIYQMLGDVSVNENDYVKKGQIIAKSGTSKLNPEGNNLHFELLKDGNIVNPNNYFGKNLKEF